MHCGEIIDKRHKFHINFQLKFPKNMFILLLQAKKPFQFLMSSVSLQLILVVKKIPSLFRKAG